MLPFFAITKNANKELCRFTSQEPLSIAFPEENAMMSLFCITTEKFFSGN
jgi:hypothetical protein